MHGLEHVRTIRCMEWESELCSGIMRARCYPFKLLGPLFHNMTVQPSVQVSDNIEVIPCIYLTNTLFAGYIAHSSSPLCPPICTS